MYVGKQNEQKLRWSLTHDAVSWYFEVKLASCGGQMTEALLLNAFIN